jgi:2-iminobutanoate/2-iminopropanoate deaminase
MSKISKLIRLNTNKGPKAIGPYSTATIHRGVMYVSGQIGVDPATG